MMRFAFVPFLFVFAATAAAQRSSAPRTPPPQPGVPPPIVFPLPQLMPPPAGGLTPPVPFTPIDLTRPPRDLYRLPAGEPFRSRIHVPGGFGGGYFGSAYAGPEPAPTERSPLPAPASGMLRFAVTPGAAQVFVDSFFVGTIDDIDAQRVLTLPAGPHRIALRAAEYEPVVFDVRIDPTDTVTYRAALERVRPVPTTQVRATGPSRMYVIPNCYIGNLPPRAERLPAGCSVKQVRVLEPPK